LLLQLEGIEKALVIKRTDGTSLYTTRDLAYHRWKSNRCDRVIDVFGKDHELVSQQLTKALALLDVKAPEYVIFEFVSLPTGSLSTRAGRYISADELMDNSETELIKRLSKFEYIVEGASLDLKPHRIAKYARELAEYFNLFYKYCPVLNAEDELRKARLALVDCARIILCDALDVLGIEAPEEM